LIKDPEDWRTLPIAADNPENDLPETAQITLVEVTESKISSRANLTRPMRFLAEGAMNHDAIVIGSGEVACATAIEAAKRGLDVVLIDDHRGERDDAARGTPVLRAKIREAISHQLAIREILASGPGSSSRRVLPTQVVHTLRRRVVERYFPALRAQLAAVGVREISGRARFISPDRILLEPGGVHTAKIIAIAVGSGPRHPKRFTFDHRVVCDVHTVTRFDRLPRHLLVVGAEAVGLEFACMFAAMGSDVTLLDRRHHTLRYVDRQLREVLYARLRSMGIELILGEDLNKIRICDSDLAPHAEVELASGRVETCDRVLVEAGRSANTEGLGLREVDIETDKRGFIVADQYQQTSRPGVCAVGDVVSNLGPVDPRQSRVAIQQALGEVVELSEPAPLTVQTTPPISMLGLTDEMCQQLDLAHVVGTVHYSDLPSSQILGTNQGALKLVVSRADRRLLGVHVVGEGASDLVHLGTVLVASGASVDELASCPYVADSLFVAYLLAAEQVLQRLATGGTPDPPRPRRRCAPVV